MIRPQFGESDERHANFVILVTQINFFRIMNLVVDKSEIAVIKKLYASFLLAVWLAHALRGIAGVLVFTAPLKNEGEAKGM